LAFDIDNFFLGYFHSTSVVAIYSFTTKITFTLISFAPVNIMFNIITPLLIKEFNREENKARTYELIDCLFKFNIFVFFTMIIFLILNLNFFLEIVFKGKYLDTVPYIFAFIPITFLPVIKNTFEPISRATGKSKVYLVTFISAVINILGNILLIPPFGITGAIISTGFSIFLQASGFVVFTIKEIDFKFDIKFIPKLSFNMLPIVVTVCYLQNNIKTSFPGLFLLNVLILAYILIVFRVNRCFNDQEARFINSFLPKKIFIF